MNIMTKLNKATFLNTKAATFLNLVKYAIGEGVYSYPMGVSNVDLHKLGKTTYVRVSNDNGYNILIPVDITKKVQHYVKCYVSSLLEVIKEELEEEKYQDECELHSDAWSDEDYHSYMEALEAQEKEIKAYEIDYAHTFNSPVENYARCLTLLPLTIYLDVQLGE